MPPFLQEISGPFVHFTVIAIRIACILVLFVLARRFADSAVKRLFIMVAHGAARSTRLDQRAETLRYIVRSISRSLLGIVLLIAIASELNFWSVIAPVLATAGIASLAIGFG